MAKWKEGNHNINDLWLYLVNTISCVSSYVNNQMETVNLCNVNTDSDAGECNDCKYDIAMT